MRTYSYQVFRFVILTVWATLYLIDDQSLRINVLSVRTKGDQVYINFQAKNGLGNDLLNLKAQDITIVEGTTEFTVDDDHFERKRTDEHTSTIQFAKSDGNLIDVSASSATIGIVFDAVQRPHADDQPDTLYASRNVLKHFLCQSSDCTTLRTKVPANTEAMGLFIPPTQHSSQAVQPSEFRDFPNNAGVEILNYLTIPRATPTNLYATINTAVQSTADMAAERGGPAIVLIVANHGDDYSSQLLNSITTLAQERKVMLITVRAGKVDPETDTRFRALADATGGVFVADPDEATIANIFAERVGYSNISLYSVSYTTKLIPDGQPKQVVMRINRGNESGSSAPVTFDLQGQPTKVKPLITTLTKDYFPTAIAIMLLIALSSTLLTTLIRWGRGRSTGISR